MKRTKKLASLLLALGLTLSLSMPAFAAEDSTSTFTVTLPTEAVLAGHTFTAYQIFDGDEANGVLSNVEWGTGINGDDFLSALKSEENTELRIADTSEDAAEGDTVNPFAACTTAADVATVLGANNQNDTLAKAVANLADEYRKGDGIGLVEGSNTLADGYYLIVDTTTNVGDGGVYNTALLQVVGDVEIQVKTSVPTVVKKVLDINDSDSNDTTNNVWQDSADHDIGDDVSFQLTATLPNNVTAYDTYKLIFHDTLSKGLEYNKDITVEIDGTTVDASNYTVTATKDNSNGENDPGTTNLTISFADAKAAGATDNSKVVVHYTAKLDTDAVIGAKGNSNTVYLEFSNNPNAGGEGTTSKTPDDTVIVFTFKTVINKINDQNQPLTGAAFKLEKLQSDGSYSLVKEFTVDEKNPASTFEFTGLDDGKYRLTETVTPDGYNSIEPKFFIIEAAHDSEKDSPALTELKAYEAKVKEDGTWEKLPGSTPDTSLEFGTATLQSGEIETNIENKSGSTLPETGGMGTTILYIAGGTMVAAAGILLITKKRMAK